MFRLSVSSVSKCRRLKPWGFGSQGIQAAKDFRSFVLYFTCFFSLQSREQGAAGNVIVLQPTKMAMTFCDIDPGRWIDVPASISFHVKFLRWDVANPRTTMPFPNNLFSIFLFLHCCRNLSRWERLDLVERGSVSFPLTSSSFGYGDGNSLILSRVLSLTHSCQV